MLNLLQRGIKIEFSPEFVATKMKFFVFTEKNKVILVKSDFFPNICLHEMSL